MTDASALPPHEESASHRLAALDAFVEFTEATATELHPHELARHALHVLLTRFPDASAVYYEPDGEVWKARVCSDDLTGELLRALQSGLLSNAPSIAHTLHTRRAVFINGWDAQREQIQHTETYGSAVNVPILVDGQVRALLSLGLKDRKVWHERDQALVRAVGRGLTLALERADTAARLHAQNAELTARTRALEAFVQLSRELGFHADPYAIIRRAGELLMPLLPQGYAVYFERHVDLWHVKVQVGSVGDPALQALADAGFPVGRTPSLDRPYETRTPWFQDAYDQTLDVPPETVGHVRSIFAAPLVVNGTVVGVFNVSLFESRTWSDVDRAVVETVLRNLQLTLEGARVVRDLQQVNDTLQERNVRLADLNAELRAYAVSMSRDLAEPTRRITGFLGLVERRAAGELDEKTRYYLQLLREEGARLDSVVRELRQLARLEHRELVVEDVPLDQLVVQVRTDLEPSGVGRRTEWIVARLPVVRGDAGMLRLALTEVLARALDVTRSEELPIVQVGCEQDEDEVRVWVQDNGPGLSTEEAEALFDVTVPSPGVTGALERVGLPNVRRILARHGGRVWAESDLTGGKVVLAFLRKR